MLNKIKRSRFVVGASVVLGVTLALAGCGAEGKGGASADGLQPVTHQLGWIASTQSMGEIVALEKGYFEEEGLDVTIELGGPNVDGVAVVASGRADVGSVSSSPSLLLAASQGIPVQAIAVGGQQHPYGFVSMPDSGITTPEDLKGKKIGTTSTGFVLVDALIRANNMEPDAVEKVPTGTELTPLLTGQVDAFGAWKSNASWLRQLPEDYNFVPLWDNGVQLYPLPYYATRDTVAKDPEMLEKFIRATARGWQFARDNTEEAVKILVEAYPNLKYEDEIQGAKALLPYIFNEQTEASGWGAADVEVWDRQIELLDSVGAFSAGAPKTEEVYTDVILEATTDARKH